MWLPPSREPRPWCAPMLVVDPAGPYERPACRRTCGPRRCCRYRCAYGRARRPDRGPTMASGNPQAQTLRETVQALASQGDHGGAWQLVRAELLGGGATAAWNLARQVLR